MTALTPLLLVLFLGDEPPARPAPDPALAERVKQVAREFKDAEAKAIETAKKAPTREEVRKAYGQNHPDQTPYARRMIELAESNPKDPAACDALVWALDFLDRGNEDAHPVDLRRAIDLAVEHHADDPEVARIGLDMDGQVTRRRDAFLEGIYANAEGHEAMGLARLALAQYLVRKAKFVAPARAWKDLPRTYTTRFGDAQGKEREETRALSHEAVAYAYGLRLLDAEAVRREAERLYREVIDDYGDVPYVTPSDRRQEERLREHPPETIADPRTRAAAERTARRVAGPRPSLARVAADRLAAIERPTVVERGFSAVDAGFPAPDIDGISLDGKPLKLSDYRGKVVALVFWGSWCAPCMEDVPHERDLVERLKGKPFALLGVACDEKAAALRAIETERMTWPHWKNAGISGRYQVYSYPTVFVIDARGTVRSRTARGAEMEKLVDELLKEAEPKP